MAETDREHDAQDAGTKRQRPAPDADPANAPTSIGPNLPRQVERNVEDADAGRGPADEAAS
ncbi:MAG: hypothetical protein ACXVFM_12695 [Solirubrobacteraceae bacterium]